MHPMRIGIDLDNTIIHYDDAFLIAARERGLVNRDFTGTKQQVRDHIRSLPDGETRWQELQGYVYGKGIKDAALFPGVKEFFASAGEHELFIVSHKTEFGHYDPDRVSLRKAALAFLKAHGLGHVPVSFHDTRAQKVDKIASLALDWFIDDLVEVYEEPHFPTATRKILFHPSASSAHGWLACRDWADISHTLAAAMLAGMPVSGVVQASSGGNSRIYKVATETAVYALKLYPTDNRNRMDTERRALELMAAHNMVPVPKWINGKAPYGLMSWVEGDVVKNPEAGDIAQAVDFLGALHLLSKNTPAAAMPLAAEACLSSQAIASQLEKRLATLMPHTQNNPAFARFLAERFLPAYEERLVVARAAPGFAAELPQGERTLIAADFGFHNMMRTTDGKLIFIDFEYFGWDDPAKLMCDFLLHPATALATDLREEFHARAAALYGDNAMRRFEAAYPLFGLRWALILLNEFIPERWQARAAARGQNDWEQVKTEQLAKAERMLEQSRKFK